MSQETFDQSLARALELRADERYSGIDIGVSLCGLGEPLLNPKTPGFVRQVRDAGFECVMSSNAALLDERRGDALLEAGLQKIHINIGDEGEEYERVYKLPFERTRDNVLRFYEKAGDACEVNIVLVDYRRDRDHLKRMVRYWQELGVRNFVFFNVMNRGGALFVDHMQFEGYAELAEARTMLEASGVEPICGAPFIFLFIGYDGNYYLCCSDWKKEVPLGSVFDVSFNDVVRAKLEHVRSREPVCKTCNWDPVNRMTERLREERAGDLRPHDKESDELLEELVGVSRTVTDAIERLGIDTAAGAPTIRKRIPVSAE
jgi:MoaA/NifB/PqqE/SkfB family radical SAM enzyme